MGRKGELAKEALVDALVRLLGERSLTAISVRDIAAEAGVNHGLVHRHFGSKEGLVQAAASRLSAEVHAGDPVQRGMSAASFAFLRERPELARILARACLDGPASLVEMTGPPPERLQAIVEPVQRALDRLGMAEAVDAHLLNALASVMLLGWFVFRPMLQEGFGLPDDADDRVEAMLQRLDELLAPYRT